MIGRRLGQYEVVAKLGEGGMGQVYRARDPRLGRDVAIKTSKEQFSARFEREARLIASLNHPNICTLHDVGPDYLVMELVEGESPRGPLPLATVVAYARQIAAALDAAHDRGIVHRDLKPANIKVTPQGLVKVLDFGLAKVVDAAGGSGDDGTTHAAETGIGSVVGTPAYMSPEQAAGRAVDKRTDIWAFGAILYELLTGARPFRGESATETIAAILQATPDLSRVPPPARPLLRRCLEKDPARRLRDIGDAMALLDDAPLVEPVRPARTRWLWPALAVVFAALAGLTWWAPWRHATPPITAKFQVVPPEGHTLWAYVVLSPDGRRLVFTAQGPDGRVRLWLRDLDALTMRPLTEITTADAYGSPFWSPDSRYIAYGDGNTLKRIDAAGAEPPVVITQMTGVLVGPGTWSRSGTILFTDRNVFLNGSKPDTSVWRVSASGGDAIPVVAAKGHTYALPWFLPDDRHFLYVEADADWFYVHVGSLDAAPDRQAPERIMRTGAQPIFVPSADSGRGWLVFMQQDTLVAQAFDPDRFTLSGDAIPLAARVAIRPTPGYGSFSMSSSGVLAYRQSGGVQLAWFDRQGHELNRVADPDFFGPIRISPDGHRGAIDNKRQIWLIDFDRGSPTRFTLDGDPSELPFWSASGTQIVFRSLRAKKFGFYVRAADGSGAERRICESEKERWIDDWSPDGRFILFNEYSPKGDVDLGMVPIEGGPPIPLLQTSFDEEYAQLSPNGHLLAYDSNSSQTGHFEVYVRTFSVKAGRPELGPEQIVSTGGGRRPLWRGGQLLFLSAGGALMSAAVQETPLHASAPVLLSQLPQLMHARFFDVDPTGQRVLLPAPAENPNTITVVTNWRK